MTIIEGSKWWQRTALRLLHPLSLNTSLILTLVLRIDFVQTRPSTQLVSSIRFSFVTDFTGEPAGRSSLS
jgi:hypothetical protein